MLKSVVKLVLIWLTIFSLVYSLWKCSHSCNNHYRSKYISTSKCRRIRLFNSSLALLSLTSSSSSLVSSSSSKPSLVSSKPTSTSQFPTNEQKNIIEAAYTKNCNIIGNAVAGSGKTSTILNIADACSKDQDHQTNILVLTYNKQLKDETKEKYEKLGLKNINIHTFHSFVHNMYSECGKDEKGILKVINTAKQPTEPFSYDIIIIDEIQDMSLLCYKFFFKLFHDNLQKNTCRIIVLGDEKQAVYEFLGSESRFLTLAPDVFKKFNNYPWISFPLSNTFRLSGNNVKFLIRNVLHEEFLFTNNSDGEKVLYYHGNPWKAAKCAAKKIINDLNNRLYKPSDVMIIAPSVTGGGVSNPTPLNVMEEMFVNANYPCYIHDNDKEDGGNKKAMKDKIMFRAYPSSKGLEREVVITFASLYYFNNFNSELRRDICPNVFYVALTRAKRRLNVIAEAKDDERPEFFRDIKNTSYLEVIDFGAYNNTKKNSDGDGRSISVTKLTSYLISDILQEAMKYISYKELSPVIDNIPLKGLVNTGNGSYEDVNDINGIAIPALYESRITNGRCSIQIECEKLLKKALWYSEGNLERKNETQQLYNEVKNIHSSNISSIFRLATIYDYVMTGFRSKMVQIENYNWHNRYVLKKCFDRLNQNINDGKKEFEVQVKLPSTTSCPQISGQIDVVTYDNNNTTTTIWELKCTESIRDEHLLQLGLYAYIYMKSMPSITPTCKILNIKTGQVLQLTSTFEELEKLFNLLVDYYLKDRPKKTDDEFLTDVEAATADVEAAAANVLVVADVVDIKKGVTNKMRKTRKKSILK